MQQLQKVQYESYFKMFVYLLNEELIIVSKLNFVVSFRPRRSHMLSALGPEVPCNPGQARQSYAWVPEVGLTLFIRLCFRYQREMHPAAMLMFNLYKFTRFYKVWDLA